MSLAPGTRLGSYEVVSILGVGGMGEVYRAADGRLNRDVAIKVLPASFARDRESLERFHREARAVAALSHPNILGIYELGDADGSPYAVMELLEGETLRGRLAGGALPVRRAVALAVQVARGLAAAHGQGIVHRDVKPENLFVTRDGRIKILDFGLARQVTAPADVTGAVTAVGTVMGTVGYMAPEQVRGLVADARSDIFAFGLVLYEMISGRRAFAHETGAETMAAIVRDDPPPLKAGSGAIPAAIDRIVWRCLEKDPAARFQSCHDLAFALETAVGDSSASVAQLAESADVRRSRSVSLRTAVPWLAAALLIGGLSGAALMRARPNVALPAVTTRRAAFDIAGLGDVRSYSAGAVSLSRDGRMFVYATPGETAGGMLRIRRLDALDSQPIDGTAGAHAPFLSPDGTIVGFQRDGQIFTAPLSGGGVTQVPNVSYLPEGVPTFTADGRIVYTGPRGELLIQRPDGSAPERLTEPKSGEKHISPHLLPGGRTILFTVVVADLNAVHIASVTLGDRTVRPIVPGGAMTPQYADGYLLYVRPDSTLVAVPFDAGRVVTTGPGIALPDRVSRTRFAVAGLTASPGIIMYTPPTRSHLVEVQRDGSRETLIADGRNWHHPRYSPDGTRIVMDLTAGGTERDVWMFDRRLRSLSRVTHLGDAHDPTWLSDGAQVSFFSFKSQGGPLMIAAADGGSEPRTVRTGGQFDPMELVNPGVWLRGGQTYIGGVRSGGQPGDIWRIPGDGGTATKLVGSPYDDVAIAISPDDRWLAYQSDETGRPQIYVRAIDGSGRRLHISSIGGTEPVWDRSGTVLYYIEPDGAGQKLVAVTLRTQPDLTVVSRTIVVQDLGHDEADNHANYDVHPKEGRFVIAQRDSDAGVIAVFDWVASLRNP